MTPELPAECSDWLKNKLNKRLESHAVTLVHRQLLVISGEQQWAESCARKVVKSLGADNLATVEFPYPTSVSITNKTYGQFLGHEFNLVIYNGFAGTRANAMMALSGTVKASGLMVLLTPPLDEWVDADDPEQVKRTSYGYKGNTGPRHFIRWLKSNIESSEGVAKLTPNGFTGQSNSTSNQPGKKTAEPFKTAHQQQAVDAIIHVLKGHRHRPLVLSADRGRGKSSSLGIAAGILASQDKKLNIVITAPRFSAVDKVFQHAQRVSPDLIFSSKHRLENNTTRIQFEATDELVMNRPEADLLMVDEAAAIPNEMLTSLVNTYSRVVFSTTLHGYEGSGRGFEIRFKAYLNKHKPGWSSHHLETPIRWSEGDLLEQFWFKVMLMDRQKHQTAVSLNGLEQTTLLSKDALLGNPALLKDAFQLLVNAHYQTEPDDLVRLLDGEDIMVFASLEKDKLVSIALVAKEGGEPLSPLYQQICDGHRRVNGHLLAQHLSYSFAQPTLAKLCYWRIVRIAVNPDAQRQGKASLLLTYIAEQAKQQQVAFIGTSFGLTEYLHKFWRHNQFRTVKVGFKKDSSSGEHSALMLKPLSREREIQLSDLCSKFETELTFQSSRRFCKLKTELLVALFSEFSGGNDFTNSQRALLEGFISGTRPSYTCELQLFALVLSCCADIAQHDSKTLFEHLTLLTAKVAQNKPMSHLKERFNITGKKQLECRLREACEVLMEAVQKK